MASAYHVCPWCKRTGFKSQRGLTQHQNSTEKCKAMMRKHFGLNSTIRKDQNFLKVASVIPANKSRLEPNLQNMSTSARHEVRKSTPENFKPNKMRRICEEPTESDNSFIDIAYDEEDTENIMYSNSTLFGSYVKDSTSDFQLTFGINTEIRDNFNNYCAHARRRFLKLNKHQSAAIDLLDRLRQKNAALNTYELMMEWHLTTNGVLNKGQKLSECSQYISRDSIYKLLRSRYNVCNKS